MAMIAIPKDFQMQRHRTPKKVQLNLNVQFTTYVDNPNCPQVDNTMH